MLPSSSALSSLERADDRLHAIQRIAQLGFWEMQIPDQALVLSDETCAIFGIAQAQRKYDLDAFLLFTHPAERERLRAAIASAVRHEVPLDIEHRIVRPDGEVRHVHARGELSAGAGEQRSYFGTIQDITERLLRQREAEQHALLLQIASRIAHMGGWQYDSAANRVEWSDELCKIHQVPLGTSPTLEQAMAFVAPEWRAQVVALLDACLHGGVAYDQELQIVTASGRKLWVRAIGEPVRNEDGTITRIQGAFQDISEKRKNEEDLHALARRLTTTLESITDAFYTLDREWRFTYLNKQAERFLQRPRETLLGKVLWDEFSALKGQVIEREYHRAVRENCTVVFEAYYAPVQLLAEVRAYPSEEGLTVYFRDITQVRKIQESLRSSEERFAILAKTTTDTIWDWDVKSDRLWFSQNLRDLFGYAPEELARDRAAWVARIHPDDRARVLERMDAAVFGRDDHWMDEYRFLRRDGSAAYVLDHGFIIRDGHGTALRMVGALVDLSERREAEARIREQASLLDKAKDAIVVRGIDNRIHYWNKGAERLYGWSAEEALGRAVDELLYDDPAVVQEATRRVLETGEWSGELTERRKDGSALQVEVQWTLMRDEAGQPQSIFAIKTDISRRKEAEGRIQYLAFYDPLTQLPNRQLLMDRLEHAIAASVRDGHLNALLFVDLDNFKSLNDTLGHTIGDLLLQQVALRLSECVGAADTVARFGGDEYVVLLENVGRTLAQAHARTAELGERILRVLNQPYQLDNYSHHTTPSIGATLFGQAGDNSGDLLKRVDLAMYQAKADGRNTVRFFDPAMQAALSERMRLEGELRHGLREHEFFLHYQPQVDRGGRIDGVEALLRWQRPERGVAAPGEFVPLAEETGLVLPLGEWVLEAACRQLAEWAGQSGMAHLEIAVNVSARQFHHPGFVGQVLGAVGRTGANPGRLKLELTETLLLDNLEDAIAKMNALRAAGISFALDDFGTGYSSLAYLKRLPLDVLKIDRSFVDDLLTNQNDAVIARTIIALGRNLGLKVIAEGVETVGQRDFLFEHGCDAYQGYLCTVPVAAGHLPAVMGNQVLHA